MELTLVFLKLTPVFFENALNFWMLPKTLLDKMLPAKRSKTLVPVYSGNSDFAPCGRWSVGDNESI